MAGSSELQLGLRLTADSSNLRAGTEQGVREVRRLREETQRGGREARSTARETDRFAGAMRNAASNAAVLHGPLGGVASRFSSIATLASRAGLAVGGAGLAASGGVMGWLSFTRSAGNAEQQLLRLEARLQATGNAAGVSVQQINAFAQQLAEDTLTSTEAVREAAAELLGFSSIAGDDFFRVISLAQDLGGDLTSNVRQLAQVLEAPEEGLGRLARRMSDLTFEQRQMIQEMIETGRHADAMRIILEHLDRQIGGSGTGEAQGLNGALDTLGVRWTRLKENLGNTEPVINATNSISGLLGVMNQYIEARNRLEKREGFSGLPGPLGAAVTGFQLRQRMADPPTPSVDTSGVEAMQRAQQAAEAEAERRRQRLLEIEHEANQERVSIERSTNDQIIAERNKMLRELEGLAAQGGLDPAAVAQAEAAVRARAAAAIEAAERPAREAAQRRAQAEAERVASQAQANRVVIQGMRREYELIQTLAGAERERAQAMDAAAARMNEFATPAQVAMAKELAASMHDALQAEERRVEIEQAEQDLSQRIAQQELLAQHGGKETEEYRVQVQLLELKRRLGEHGARMLEEQVRQAERLTKANRDNAQAQNALERIFDQADPTRALERQLELIEELKAQFPQYADALEQAAGQVRERIDEINSGLISTRRINRDFAYGAGRGLDSFAEDIANGRDALESFSDAFRQFAADFLRQIAQMIIQQAIFNALQNSSGGGIGGAIAGGVSSLATFHGGGLVGSGGTRTNLGPDELLTLTRRNEEILTTNDPRHRFNQGSGGEPVAVNVFNTVDPDDLAQRVLSTRTGQKNIINILRANKREIKGILN